MDILDLAWHLATRMKFRTWEQNWDFYGAISGLWSQLGPSPKFGTSLQTLFLLLGFFFSETKFSKTETETYFRDQIFLKPKPILFFRNQIFRNRNRDFFPRLNFSETETDTFLLRPNFPKPKPRLSSETNFFWNRHRDFFPKPKPKPSKIWQKFWNREVSKLKCQSLATISSELLRKVKPFDHSRASKNRKMPHFDHFFCPGEFDP